jgi:hypothetical protein
VIDGEREDADLHVFTASYAGDRDAVPGRCEGALGAEAHGPEDGQLGPVGAGAEDAPSGTGFVDLGDRRSFVHECADRVGARGHNALGEIRDIRAILGEAAIDARSVLFHDEASGVGESSSAHACVLGVEVDVLGARETHGAVAAKGDGDRGARTGLPNGAGLTGWPGTERG